MTLTHQPGVPGRARRPALSAGAVAAPARPAAQLQAKDGRHGAHCGHESVIPQLAKLIGLGPSPRYGSSPDGPRVAPHHTSQAA